jgi:hypothetical protein
MQRRGLHPPAPAADRSGGSMPPGASSRAATQATRGGSSSPPADGHYARAPRGERVFAAGAWVWVAAVAVAPSVLDGWADFSLL